MAGTVRSDFVSENSLDYDKFIEQIQEDPTKAGNLLTEAKSLVEQGSAIRLNRSITDNYIEQPLETNSIFKKEFSSLKNLHVNLEAYGTITDKVIIELAKNCPQLRKINLKSCVLVSDNSIIDLAKNCQGIEEIDLGWCDISEKSVLAIAEHCKNLKGIGVRSCYITDRSILALVKGCKNITKLSLAWCKSLTDETLYGISVYCPKLEVLDLRGNEKITTEALVQLTKQLKNLKALHLKRCPSTDAVLSSIADHATLLEKINLRGCYRDNNVTNSAIVKIAKNCTDLSAIDLSGCHKLTDQSLLSISNIANLLIKSYYLIIISFLNKQYPS